MILEERLKSLEKEGEQLLNQWPQTSLREAYKTLSQVYREKKEGGTQKGSSQHSLFAEAYLGGRAPATLKVLSFVMAQLKSWIQADDMKTFLDLGAGLGLSTLIMEDCFPSLVQLTLEEPNLQMTKLGQALLKKISLAPERIKWEAKSSQESTNNSHDLVLLSYVLNELSEKDQEDLVKAAWTKTKKTLILIETGTPEGFEIIKRAREILRAGGAFLWAPCLHQEVCPMERPNWCHFSVRVPRTKTHRFLKEGSLGYEDEKFSYLVVGREERRERIEGGRVLSPPRKRPGHFLMDVCTSEGDLEVWTRGRSQAGYKEAKAISWGQVASADGKGS